MNLSIEEKIGQRFIFGINDKNIDCIIELIEKAYIGGVVLYKKNYNNYNEMLSVIKRIRNANKNNKIPLFIAIDQEGGRVNRMPSDIHLLKSVYDISKVDSSLIIDSANIMGKMLNSVGINMNLAPVMDIYSNSKSKVLYKRCFCGSSEDVSKFGICYMNKLRDEGVIPVIKHFPGHGISKYDSHLIVPYIFNYKKLLNEHMLPFKDAIKNGADVIMIGHLVVRKLTRGLPASISNSFIKEYLRKIFNGVVMTDELNMLKRNILYRNIYLKKALVSDNDILLIKIKNSSEGYKIINKYREIIINNQECIKNLNNNVKRIINLKEKYKLSDEFELGKIDVKNINQKIDEINKMVDFTKEKK